MSLGEPTKQISEKWWYQFYVWNWTNAFFSPFLSLFYLLNKFPTVPWHKRQNIWVKPSSHHKVELWVHLHYRLYKRNGRNIRGVTHWFVDCCFEANSLESGQPHLENFRCMLGKIKTRILLIWAWGGAMGGAGRLLWLWGLDLEDIGQSTCQSGRSPALMHTLLYRHI